MCASCFAAGDVTDSCAEVASGEFQTHLTEAPTLKTSSLGSLYSRRKAPRASSGICKIASMNPTPHPIWCGFSLPFGGNLLAVTTGRSQSLHFSHCSAEPCFRLLSPPQRDKIHPQASPPVPENGSGPMQTTGQINQPTPALSVSLPSETQSTATPGGLSCYKQGFAIINYPKIISIPGTAVFTSSVFAGGLIAAALAALRSKSWGRSKPLITTITQ